MRILRLTNSNDFNPLIPEGERVGAVAERMLTGLTGEPVETVSRVIWPRPTLPALLDEWLARYEPDLVLLCVSSFWFTYESVPLKIERKLGPVGRPVARAGLRAAEFRPFSSSWIFHALRRLMLRTVGGATHFTSEYVAELMESCIRRILAHEQIALVVRGPMTAHSADAGKAARRRVERRWWFVENAMAKLCRQLHIEYVSMGTPFVLDRSGEGYLGDRVHVDVEVHRQRGESEGRAMVAAWRRHREGEYQGNAK